MVKAQDVQEALDDYKRETDLVIKGLKEMVFGLDSSPEQGLMHRVVAMEMARHVTGSKFQHWLEQFFEEEKTPDRLRQILKVLRLAGCNVTVEDDLAEAARDVADAEQDYEAARVLAEDHREEHRRALVQADKRFEEAKERLNASDAQKLLDQINGVEPAEESDSPDVQESSGTGIPETTPAEGFGPSSGPVTAADEDERNNDLPF